MKRFFKITFKKVNGEEYGEYVKAESCLKAEAYAFRFCPSEEEVKSVSEVREKEMPKGVVPFAIKEE